MKRDYLGPQCVSLTEEPYADGAALLPVPGSRKMEYKGNSWHETCFLCHRCQQPIGTKSFIPKDTGYFCVPCFEKQFAYQCCACKKVM
ncbi:Four and a half LIM domains protein 2 [Liparis tanakae]|uniref:Four and a half LIM domains protein 2 n=1 Tax=Liparis tanakae TaxID=230148 RepID=A0A4Z2E7L4_9TELE|nr:Four and a half LIM domains protein 2 [Liparis tanakae]